MPLSAWGRAAAAFSRIDSSSFEVKGGSARILLVELQTVGELGRQISNDVALGLGEEDGVMGIRCTGHA